MDSRDGFANSAYTHLVWHDILPHLIPSLGALMVNKVLLIGNLGQDPEMRSTASGTSVANLRLATTDRRKDREGNWNDHTEWHSVVAFGRTAENVAQYCRKGKQLFVEGRLQTRKWQTKEGVDRYSTEIVADNIRFLGGRGDSAGSTAGYGAPSYPQQQAAPAPAPAAAAPAPAPDAAPANNGGNMPYQGDEDIPF
jgi:single-strand DNA-binding protein